MLLWWSLPLATIMSMLLTGGVRRYALARSVLDLPNQRSSHTAPTPRGGGVAIALTFLMAVALLVPAGVVDSSVALALVGAGFVVAFVGFLDDHSPIAVSWRLLAHFCAVVWALAWLGGLPPVTVVGAPVNMGYLGHALAAIYLAWLLNLYNFMDGIDGIAGLEAVTVGLGASGLYLLHSSVGQEWLLPAILAMAALGFLVWNWPPAKVFMGDAGSGFLGLMLGILSIRAARLGPELLWSWLILLGVFVVDATFTLLRRLLQGERIFEAHHRHAYQCAARRFGGHRQVILGVAAINLFWLLPVAIVVGLGLLNGLVGALLAYVPLVWLGIQCKAGAALDQDTLRSPRIV